LGVPNCLILSSGISRWCDSYLVNRVDWSTAWVIVMGYPPLDCHENDEPHDEIVIGQVNSPLWMS